MKGVSGGFCARPGWARRLDHAGLSSLDRLSARDLGEPVTDHRSSWVRRATIDTTTVYIKTYDYPTPLDRWRGLFRTTFLAPSRARREWQALLWLRAEGFAAPEPLVLAEHRRHGLLHRATLVTEAYPGTPLDQLLPELEPTERDRLLLHLEAHVAKLHRAGFRDRNLDLRNLLARQLPTGAWEIAKIDSPRHRLRPPGPAHDRCAREDWDRLTGSLRTAGLL